MADWIGRIQQATWSSSTFQSDVRMGRSKFDVMIYGYQTGDINLAISDGRYQTGDMSGCQLNLKRTIECELP